MLVKKKQKETKRQVICNSFFPAFWAQKLVTGLLTISNAGMRAGSQPMNAHGSGC